ncbi:sigma-70 family RNA polymerase sigma factor [Pimelobacter simplex]|uniref:sigma-70 family RNA polymerase sigma factor n=1 Tax=Nocardioides simplex TaxID=2045 RepID=UPI0019331C5B|nr:sigma-70 family RNA polymerase sigma factor [Pimelobacter simplex]
MLPVDALLPALSDEPELLARARNGDSTAITVLYARHVHDARHLARALAGPDEADDLLADVFTRVVARFRAGGGPTESFHAYLTVAIRNRHRDLVRRRRHEEPLSDQPWLLDTVDPPAVGDDLPEGFDREVAAEALATLPAPWREVIVLLEIEDRPVAEVAESLGLTLAAVSSLGYRAREGLRTAYLDRLVARSAAGSTGATGSTWCVECGWVHTHLGRYVRGTIGAGLARRIDAHLGGCEECARTRTRLRRVNHMFRRVRLTGERPIRQLGTPL